VVTESRALPEEPPPDEPAPEVDGGGGDGGGGDGGGGAGDGGKRYQQNEPIGTVTLMNGAGLKSTSLDDPKVTEPKTGRFALM